MKLIKIDENGFFLEDVILNEIPKISVDDEVIDDPSYISTPCPDGFYKPKWDGEWIEGLSVEEIADVALKPHIIPETEKLWDMINYLISSGYES